MSLLTPKLDGISSEESKKTIDYSDAECGLELCVKIPQIPDANLQELKDNIKQIVKRDNTSGQAAHLEIKYSFNISDAPGDAASQMIKVVLHGEVEKVHYDLLRDVQCKLKNCYGSHQKVADNQKVGNEVNSNQTLGDDILAVISICSPSRLYSYAQRNGNSLKKALSLALRNYGVGNFCLKLKKGADSTPPEVDAVAYVNVDCNDSHVQQICQKIKQTITTWIPNKKAIVTCQPCCRAEHTQEVPQGKISYALTYNETKLMMDVTYPEKLTADPQTTNTSSGTFQEGIREALSKIDLEVVRRKLSDVDQHEGGEVENGRDLEHGRSLERGRDLERVIEDHETAQVKGYKRAHIVCINISVINYSKDEITHAILHQIKQMSC